MFTRLDNNLVTLVHCFPHDAPLLLVCSSNQRITLLFQFGELGVCLTCHFQQEKEEAIRDIRRQVAVLSVDIAEKIIRHNLDKEQDQMEMIDRMLDEMLTANR